MRKNERVRRLYIEAGQRAGVTGSGFFGVNATFNAVAVAAGVYGTDSAFMRAAIRYGCQTPLSVTWTVGSYPLGLVAVIYKFLKRIGLVCCLWRAC